MLPDPFPRAKSRRMDSSTVRMPRLKNRPIARYILLLLLAPLILTAACSKGSSDNKSAPPPNAQQQKETTTPAKTSSPASFSGVELPCSFTINDVAVRVSSVSVEAINNPPGYFTIKISLEAHEKRGANRDLPWKDFIGVVNRENAMIGLSANVQIYGQGNRAYSSGDKLTLPANGLLFFELSYSLSESDFPAQIRLANSSILQVTAPSS